jgi:hypothetical protein
VNYMQWKFTALSFLPLFAGICMAQGLQDAPLSQRMNTSSTNLANHIPSWTASKVQHAYGLPEAKPKAKGTLTISNSGLTFISKSGQYAIPWLSTVAVSNGSERVELWGTTGRIVRMMIPDGGGFAAAGVMHHKVSELTIEFDDPAGAYHGAVFFLPGNDAARVLDSYTQAVRQASAADIDPGLEKNPEPTTVTCSDDPNATRNVRIAAPTWNQTDVPAAYRALIYEHIVDRMRRVPGVSHVYRAGERRQQATCPQVAVAISVVSFKPGSQVRRAAMGPVGFFASTTQMVFSANITDASGKLIATREIKATVRGESESKKVAEGVANKLARYYDSSVKQYEKSASIQTALHPSSL